MDKSKDNGISEGQHHKLAALYAEPGNFESSGTPVRSYEEILARLAGPVQNESEFDSDTPLASLNLRDLINLSGKNTAELANAPETSAGNNPDNLKSEQYFFALSH